MNFVDAIWTVVKVAAGVAFGMNIAGLLGWVERKQSAVMQDRIGANRADIFGFRILGLFHPLADAIKMLTKEDFVSSSVVQPLHTIAPVIAMGGGLFCLAALPYGGTIQFLGRAWSLQPLECSCGVPLVLAALAFGVHGVMMAGYASGSNYGMLGGLRGAAQMVASEVCLASSLAGLLFLYGTLDFQQAVAWQSAHAWGIVFQPLAFILFLTAGAAVTKRTPFDLPEGESEIVGFHVEYSGMKFGMFLITDFMESIVICGVTAALFLGGWLIPGLDLPSMGLLGGVLMLASFTVKVLALLFLLMQIRWTLPRFRFDQLLDLGWKNLLPLSLLNFLVTAWGIYLWR